MSLEIRNLAHHSDETHEWYSADVVDGEARIHVDNFHGSWAVPLAGGRSAEVLPEIAEGLQLQLPERFRRVKRNVSTEEVVA